MAIEPIVGRALEAASSTTKIRKKDGFADVFKETLEKQSVDDKKTSVSSTSSIQESDSVTITSVAQGITRAFKVNSNYTVNASRVAEIKKALAEGTFKIDPTRTARNIMRLDGLSL